MNGSPAPHPIQPWNKGRIVGQKRPLKSRDVWRIRTHLELDGNKRDLALFNLAIDSKLRASDLVSIKVSDIQTADQVRERASVIQMKTGRPVQFELTEPTRLSVEDYGDLVPAPNCQNEFLYPRTVRDARTWD